MVAMLLDAYFAFCSPIPEEGCIRECKTSLQIRDELDSMFRVDVYDVATYMLQNHYIPTTEANGTVTWEIYRMVTTD